MGEMAETLAAILKIKQKGQGTYVSFLDWVEPYYTVMFGPAWEKYSRELRKEIQIFSNICFL
jgi:hypothetical protein